MTKYSIIVFRPEIMQFLEKLQEIGMMDITRSERAFDDKSREALSKAKRYSNAAKKLEEFAKENKELEAAKIYKSDIDNLVKDCEELFADIEELSKQKQFLEKEAESASVWGEFSSNDIQKLLEIGLTPRFYMIPEKKFKEEWGKDYVIQTLAVINGRKYFTVLSEDNQNYSFPLKETRFPEKPESELRKDIAEIEKNITNDKKKLLGFASAIGEIKKNYSEIMEDAERYFASESSNKEAEETLAVLEGFSPTENDREIQNFLDQSGALYINEAAKAEDNPPVKLKNNFFTKIFEPIGELYELPNYGELDLTPYFAPFYMLFFGMCLGDMGYGLILVIVSLIIMWKIPKMKKYGRLILMLGIGTIIMPALSGTFFGAKIYNLVPLPENINNFFFSDLKMFWFSIIFGVFQVVIARIVSGIYAMIYRGWQYGMSNIGWSLILIWLSLLYAGSQMNKVLAPEWMKYVFGIGGLICILFFSKTEGNILKRFFAGFFSLYDITGFFGDVLSYIRLFGLGCAGGILGMVVNSIALKSANIPYAGILLCVLFLIMGHTFVLLLSALGAFVHPLRLTFVEFYKNAGFTGGGKEYKPLKKNKEDK